MPDLILSPKDIVNKEFKGKMRGYDPDEVDEFLDQVIKDYEAYSKELNLLREDNERLKEQVELLGKEKESASRIQPEVPRSATVTNFDILKRLSNLEKEVFGKKLIAEDTPEEVSEPTVVSGEIEEDLEATRQF